MEPSLTPVLQSLEACKGCRLVRRLEGSYRNNVYLAERGRERLVVKTTRRSEAALIWLLPVYKAAREVGFVVPAFVPSGKGAIVVGGVTVETFVEGRALAQADWLEVLPLIRKFHTYTKGTAQRPGFASARELLTRERGEMLTCAECHSSLRRAATPGRPSQTSLKRQFTATSTRATC